MIKITYCKDDTNNWGDYIVPVLTKYISGQDVMYVQSNGFTDEEDVYAVVGSVLCWQQKPNLYVWGPGFMAEGESMLVKPKKVYAVRGPMTRRLLLNQGIDCPEVYGDPALLFPRYYNPSVEKKYKLGIIPHYVDSNSEWIKSINQEDVKVLDICMETHEFVNSLKECENIISSSLHGVIAADAYEIPNMWITINGSKDVYGSGFKFRDYFASVKRDEKCFEVSDDRLLDSSLLYDILKEIPPYGIDIDLDLLYSACPFRKD
jgi:pyruvyltransferase